MTDDRHTDLEWRCACIEARYDKHLADTHRPDNKREFIRYVLQYEHIVPSLSRPKYPPEPKNSPGMMIYEHIQHKKGGGASAPRRSDYE